MRNILALAKEALSKFDKQALAEFNDVLEDNDIERVENLLIWTINSRAVSFVALSEKEVCFSFLKSWFKTIKEDYSLFLRSLQRVNLYYAEKFSHYAFTLSYLKKCNKNELKILMKALCYHYDINIYISKINIVTKRIHTSLLQW